MSRKSIVIGLSVFLLICISLTFSNAKANSPANMVLNYDSNTKMLNATITHNIGSIPNHYIESVTIRVNGSIVRIETYTSQPSPTTFTYQYDNITANNGATIQVLAVCSISGSITRSLVVGDGGNGLPPTDGEPGIPGYLGVLLIMGFSVIILGMILRKKLRV
ncbi:MAG: hypothetical protein ACFFEN_15000 [Candidatus Thorarchaeota archaeon]